MLKIAHGADIIHFPLIFTLSVGRRVRVWTTILRSDGLSLPARDMARQNDQLVEVVLLLFLSLWPGDDRD